MATNQPLKSKESRACRNAESVPVPRGRHLPVARCGYVVVSSHAVCPAAGLLLLTGTRQMCVSRAAEEHLQKEKENLCCLFLAVGGEPGRFSLQFRGQEPDLVHTGLCVCR